MTRRFFLMKFGVTMPAFVKKKTRTGISKTDPAANVSETTVLI